MNLLLKDKCSLRLIAFLDKEVADSACDDQQHDKKPTHDEMESFHRCFSLTANRVDYK